MLCLLPSADILIFIISRRYITAYPVIRFYSVSQNTTKRVIYAYGADDPVNATSLQYHGSSKSGSRYLALLEPDATALEKPEDAKKWTVIQKHTVNSDRDTVYWCNIAKFPQEESQVHYIGVSNADVFLSHCRGFIRAVMIWFSLSKGTSVMLISFETFFVFLVQHSAWEELTHAPSSRRHLGVHGRPQLSLLQPGAGTPHALCLAGRS